jgi:copper/silver efflux system protein
MIARLIHWSIHNRLLVLLATVIVTAWGIWSVRTTPLDAIPDLSDVQVIVRTTWTGQAPQLVEDQVTYPLTTTMLGVPQAKAVRGYSMFGESLVYVLFEDGTDLYWARSRVLEALSQVQSRLPATARSALGPDATGVGWVYEYALVDRSGQHDLGQLRAIQDWFLRYELQALENVAEVATVGGFVQQFQIVVDPERLRSYGIGLDRIIAAVQAANAEAGGSVIELAEAEYMVRARGYLRTLDDLRSISLALGSGGTPLLLGDVATIQRGPELRRGIAELDGEGEVVGGIVVMRQNANAATTIAAVKQRLEALRPGLPAGVEIVETYDRSALIERAVDNLRGKLIEEFIVVGLICVAFLLHLRSALVAIVTLPLGVLVAFIVMRHQGINANIMSLGGIAIAIGAMVDAAVVMVENAHKKLERAGPGGQRAALIAEAAAEVGPALFFSLLIITVSFLPVFALQAQEGRLFAPLAYTKTYAMAAAAGLSVTLVPALMTLFIRGRLRAEHENPLNRGLISAYRPLIDVVLRHPRATLGIAALLLAVSLWPLSRLGTEFMPALDEGDLLYMPTALPGLSAGKAAELLQQTDRIIKSFPEVERVFGKIGRAESATDPAPLEMVETTIRLKPRTQWRPGMTPEKLVAELDAALQIPGMGNVWVQPIRNRIDMLATGIKSPVGIKIAGPDLAEIERIAADVEAVVREVPGASSVFAERVGGGRYIEIVPDRLRAARHGLSIDDVQRTVAFGIGGGNIGEVVDGLARFPINLRFARELRDGRACLAAARHRWRRGNARQHRLGGHRRWPTDDQERERASGRLCLCRHPRPQPRRLCRRRQTTGRRSGGLAARLLTGLVRPVRVSGAGDAAAAAGRAADAGADLHVAAHELPARRRGPADHDHVAVRAGRRHLVHVSAGTPAFGCLGGRLHCAGRCRCRVRRDHAAVSAAGHGPPAHRGRSSIARSDHRGRRDAGASQGDDGGDDSRRSAAAVLG